MGMTGGWFRRPPSDDEMRDELEAHVAMRAEHDGVDEAAARRRLGNALRTREQMRRVWIAQWWDALRQDAHFTWRSWRRRPAFALSAVLVLGLGLGASTALFAALDRVLFRPLPYADPDRLVSVGLLTARAGEPFGAAPEMMRDRNYVQAWDMTPEPFESVTSMATVTCTIAEGQLERVPCGVVEHNFLGVLGVRVTLGRDFAPEDDVRGAPRGALISHRLWVRRYGADPAVVGRRVSLETSRGPMPQIPILGVLPADFETPVDAADILLPSQMRPLDPRPQILPFSIMAFARLDPDVTPGRAEQMLASQWADTSTFAGPGFRAVWRVRSLHDRRVGDAARVGWLLVGSVTIFLLIACVNVTNLILARVAERQREFAVRAAVGAGKLRLARLALVESLLLALVAGGAGLLLASALLKAFVAMAPAVGVVAKSVAEASIDGRVFVAAAVLVVMTGMAIGLWPAISVFRAGGMRGLRSTTTSSPGAKPRVRFALVTTQVALTLALLGGSALLLRTLWNVVNVPLGFNGERVITLSTTVSTRYSPERWNTFLGELLARAQATPGAVSAALGDALVPPQRSSQRTPIRVEGRPPDANAPPPAISFRWVTPQYFDTFRIPMLRGRTTGELDVAGEPVVVLNESAERVLFRGERALGQRIQSPTTRFVLEGSTLKALPSPSYTVVGVSADIRNGQTLTDEPGPEIYLVARLGTGVFPNGHLSLRTTASSADANAFLRQIAADLDPKQFVTIQTQEELLTELTAQRRFIAWLLTAFAALALLLAAAGLFSVASYLVLQRRRDIGVRMAIGAAPRDVARQFVGEAGRWIIGGAVLGCALGWMGTRTLQSQLYQVEALDPWAWTGALLALALVLMIAVFRPAYRAAHVDPVTALRAD